MNEEETNNILTETTEERGLSREELKKIKRMRMG